MPYAPDQPWDSGLSYTYGQSCTFNGLRYIWWNVFIPSNVGVDPTVDEVLFTASGPSGSTDSRLERGWILADPSYDNWEMTVRQVRNVPDFIPNLYFERPQGPAWHNKSMFFTWTDGDTLQYQFAQNKDEKSWAYYGQYEGYSTDFGLANVGEHVTVPADFGYTGIGVYTSYAPYLFDGANAVLTQNVVSSTSTEYKFKVMFIVNLPPWLENGNADTVSVTMWYERDISYTAYVIWETTDAPYKVIQSVTGTINSGPVREDSTNPPAYGPEHTFARPPNAIALIDNPVLINSFTPSLDN